MEQDIRALGRFGTFWPEHFSRHPAKNAYISVNFHDQQHSTNTSGKGITLNKTEGKGKVGGIECELLEKMLELYYWFSYHSDLL